MPDMTDDIDFDDDDSIRIARRQWMDPDRKEKVMGKLKQMLLDPKTMSQERIIDALCCYKLIGFGEASFMDLEKFLGHPDIHPDHFGSGGLGIAHKNGVWNLRCAWGIYWDDGHCVVIHDRNNAVKEVEDTKHWHITGSHDAWARLIDGYVLDTDWVRLEANAR